MVFVWCKVPPMEDNIRLQCGLVWFGLVCMLCVQELLLPLANFTTIHNVT